MSESDQPFSTRELAKGVGSHDMSVEHRLVLTLHYLDGYTVPALAKELGRSVKSVEGLVIRAKRNLQRELGARNG